MSVSCVCEVLCLWNVCHSVSLPLCVSRYLSACLYAGALLVSELVCVMCGCVGNVAVSLVSFMRMQCTNLQASKMQCVREVTLRVSPSTTDSSINVGFPAPRWPPGLDTRPRSVLAKCKGHPQRRWPWVPIARCQSTDFPNVLCEMSATVRNGTFQVFESLCVNTISATHARTPTNCVPATFEERPRLSGCYLCCETPACTSHRNMHADPRLIARQVWAPHTKHTSPLRFTL